MVFKVEPGKCTECGRCTTVCSIMKVKRIQPLSARIRIRQNWPEVPDIHVCRFEECPEHPCVASCSFDAFIILDGKVFINEENCKGCKKCLEACPYQAITYDNEKRVALKCDLCDGTPACVSECITGALYWGEE